MKAPTMFALALGLSMASAVESRTTTPLALPLDRLSSGAILLLDRSGDLVQWPTVRPRILSADESLAAGLDARIGSNIRLGDDPAQLPAGMRAQAEPHIARHPAEPDFLVAVFQEGRYTNGAAVDCGYSVSRDGGLTWTRALIPGITTAVGGPYYRASDPVAGVDLNGNVYLNTIASLDTGLTMTAILVSRSTDGGVTFDPPREVARSPNSSVFLDKNWMAVNTFAGTPTAGRLAVTWTRFAGPYYPIVSSVSDDGGQTWNSPTFVTPTNSTCQGSQPVFLPDGKLALVYWNFASQDPGFEYVQIALSSDGGTTWDYSGPVAKVQRYDAPAVRDGVFLPSAASCRTNNNLFVVYQGLYQSKPKILFTRSLDGGVTWSASVPVSDNDTTPVFNPAIGVSPDGQSIAVTFYDGRMNPTNSYLVDLFLAQSLDGGFTWQPNERLTTSSTDVRLAPLTPSGYMLGDYMGVAPPEPPHVPAVPVWVDTRTGDPDPFVTRAGISSNLTFSAWRAARFSLAEINQAQVGAPDADPDHDGLVNALEYAFGLNPRAVDQPAFAVSTFGEGVTATLLAKYQRLRSASDVLFVWDTSTNLLDWSGPASIPQSVIPDKNPQFEEVTATLGATSEPGMSFRLSVELLP